MTDGQLITIAIGLIGLGVGATGVGIALWNLRSSRRGQRSTETASEFRANRRHLKSQRAQLSRWALGLYPAAVRMEGVALLSVAEWLPQHPIPIEAVQLELSPGEPTHADLVAKLGSLWPRQAHGDVYARYSDVVAELDRPATFFNGYSFQLLRADLVGEVPSIVVAAGHYFDWLDTGEALGYEVARQHRRGRTTPRLTTSRKMAGAAAQCDRRASSIGISTLTLVRRGETTEFWLHRRGAGTAAGSQDLVAAAQNTLHVIPAGEFQPASASSFDVRAELDLWKSISREFAEEFLDLDDIRQERGRPIDPAAVQAIALLDDARAAGTACAFLLGIGIDPLVLKAEAMTVLVIDGPAFDAIVGVSPKERNREGLILGPYEFTEAAVAQVVSDPNALPAGAGALLLALRHRAGMTCRSGIAP